jgi:hypothetical protein
MQEQINERVRSLAQKKIAEFSIKTDKVKTEAAISKVFEYVGGSSPPQFDDQYYRDIDSISKVLAETKFSIRYLGQQINYFKDGDQHYRDIYRISIARMNVKASFMFGASIVMTNEHEQPDLYDIMTSINSDYSAAVNGKQEFYDNMELDEDSIRAKKMWTKLEKHFDKLSKIFDESEIWSFPS